MGPDIDVLTIKIEGLQYREPPEDLVDAISIPILMIGEAVKSMEEVVKTAKEIEEAKKKEFILLFLSAVLLIILVVGSALASVGLGTLGRVLAILGEVGQAALGIYDVANNPKSAPLAIFGLILGAAGIGKYRRDMTPEVIGKLGGISKGNLDSIAKA